MDETADARRILTGVHQSDWSRPVGRPYTSWIATLKSDLSLHNLTFEDAIELAMDKPLWRLLVASGATHWHGACRIMMMMTLKCTVGLVYIIIGALQKLCMHVCTLCLKKGPRDNRLQLWKGLTDFNDFWHKYSWHSWPSKLQSIMSGSLFWDTVYACMYINGKRALNNISRQRVNSKIVLNCTSK